MALSPEQEAKLRAAAQQRGVDPDALVAAAANVQPPSGAPAPSDAKSGPSADVKLFQYHLPFIRANELRAYLQLPADAPDGEMFCGEWLAKHGGILSGPTASPPAPTPAE